MIELGRAIMVQQVLTNASREGARIAVLDGSTAAGVKSKVVDYLNGGAIPAATAGDVEISPPEPAVAAYGDPVTVTVHIPFSRVSWLPAPWFLGGNTQLRASTVMRRETVQ